MHPTHLSHQPTIDPHRPASGRRSPRAKARVWAIVSVALLGALVGAAACINRPLCAEDCQPLTTNVFVATIENHSIDKIDLLLMIDNSSSMADKQKVLQKAVPDLVRRLVDPNCVNPDGTSVPATPGMECPGSQLREFPPIRDIHVGIISSSLGSHGSTNKIDCLGSDSDPKEQELNDHGWLVGTRSRFAVPPGGAPVDTQKGFLDWNPVAHPGQSVEAFNTTFAEMTLAAGSDGCGYESQLESIYRFLVDPHPSTSIHIGKCAGGDADCAFPDGRDDTLLAQRAAFLRPDSLVAIIMLTDENDCSIRESGQGFYASSSNRRLPRASNACSQNPNDHCCYSCGGARPNDCPEDPLCANPVATDDEPNLRCFQQVQRFGVDFLYPTERYVNALKEQFICTSRDDLAATDATHCPDLDHDMKPDIVANPLFKTNTAVTRDPSLIFFAGILGVPWQDIATRIKPDGKEYPNADRELHYQTASQLADKGTWKVILGDAHPGGMQAPIPPTDALMQESKNARGGVDGESPPAPLAGTEAGYLANRVNGHEWMATHGGRTVPDDLEYACIFPLLQPNSCDAASSVSGCDCKQDDLGSKSPLCQNSSGSYTTQQLFGKAYPGLRELQVLKDFGDNSIVASICARNLTDDKAQDYGYRPAVDAIVDRLKDKLSGSCLPRPLTPGKNGEVPCSVVEVRPVPMTGRPACESTPGRKEPKAEVVGPSLERMRQSGKCDVLNRPNCNQFYVCEIVEAKGTECHTGATPPSPGWCYIDPSAQPDDNPELVATCPATQKQVIRFVDPDHRTPANDATALVACFGGTIRETPSVVNLATGGAGGTGP